MSEIQNSSIFSLDDVDFDEGDLVNGTVVKIERDEVLVDIGFKSEGVIPVRELSIRLDANPAALVALGAFVDLGGIDGLIHISELSWNHVNHPSEVVKVGHQVKVKELDLDRRRISLSMKSAAETLGIEIEVAPLEGEEKAEDAE